MSLKSLLAASLFLAVCSVPMVAKARPSSPNIADAAAATPAPQPDTLFRVPSMKGTQERRNRGSFVAADPKNPRTATALKGLEMMKGQVIQKSEMAQRDNVCYTLREQRFRAPADGSNMPVPNGSTTCTETSELRLRNAQVVPVTVQAVPAK